MYGLAQIEKQDFKEGVLKQRGYGVHLLLNGGKEFV
jgi:hypothetical protein